MIYLILISLVLGLLIYLCVKIESRTRDVFEKQGLKYKNAIPVLGDVVWLITGKLIESTQKIYNNFPNEKVVGFSQFTKPNYFLRSPDVIKQITVKDFSYFQDHLTFKNDSGNDFFKKVLFSMKGKQWRDMRSSLSPMFTGSKMRIMLDLIKKCCKQLCDHLQEQHDKNKDGELVLSIKTLFAMHANDVISTCAFGIEVNTLKDPKNEVYSICQQIMDMQFMKFGKFLLLMLFPKVTRFFPKNMEHKFKDLITHTMNVREKENIWRPDMLQLLMNLKKGQLPKDNEIEEIDPENKMINGEIKKNWTDDELIAQCFQFFLGGFHTTSTALSFCSYALATNPDLQERLIQEIDENHEQLDRGSVTYEVLQKMKYMNMFISEVLRLWPIVVISNRECKNTYTYEGDDGFKFTIQKDDVVIIPIYSLHRDPKYFPDPEKFDPERFNDKNKPNINIYTYLPFGIGPRNCIAFRFALMQMKAVIYELLLNFRLKPCKETQIPLKIKLDLLGTMPEKEIYLKIVPRKDKKIV